MYKKLVVLLFIILVMSLPVSAYNKQFYENNKTLSIKQVSTNNTLFTIQQISSIPGVTTMEEIFNITSYITSDYTFSAGDIGFGWKKYKGINNITGVDFYLFKQSNYSIIVPDYTYPWQNVSSEVSCGFLNLSTCTIWNNATIPTIIGNHTEVVDNSSWVQLSNLNGKVIKSGKSYLIKVIFHKIAETGSFAIQTIPSFVGVSEDRMTWWNGSWQYSYNNPNATIGVYSLNISNNTVPFGNSTHVNISGFQQNLTDLRFVRGNVTVEPYWRETNTSENGTGYGRFWFNVTGNDSVQIYSGAIGVADASNGTNIFDFFDDFSGDLSKWTVSGDVQIVSGELQIVGTNSWTTTGMVSIFAPSKPFIVEATARVSSTTSPYLWFGMTNAINAPVEPSGNKNLGILLGSDATQFLRTRDSISVDVGDFSTNTVAYKFIVKSATGYTVFINSSQVDDDTTWTQDTSTQIVINKYSNGNYGYIDNIRVRKYVSPEPVWATWGQAETSSSPPFCIICDPSFEDATLTNWSQAKQDPNNELISGSSTDRFTNGSKSIILKATGSVATPPTQGDYVERVQALVNLSGNNELNFDLFSNSSGVCGLVTCKANFSLSLNGTIVYNYTSDDSAIWKNISLNTTAFGNATNLSLRLTTVGAFNLAGDTSFFIDNLSEVIDTIPPSSITSLTNTTGNFWHNWTWVNPIDSDFGGVMIYINGTFIQNQTGNFYNLTANPHNRSNISTHSIDIIGNMNSTWVNNTSIIPNNPVTISGVSTTYSLNELQTLTISATSTDADNDIPLYLTNASKGTINNATGVFTWNTVLGDNGTYNWQINVSDLNGSISMANFTVTVNTAPGINITSWSNNKTNNLNLTIAFNSTDIVLFNATANQTIMTWHWFKDDVNQSHNFDNISINFATSGVHTIKVNASNANGTSNTITWTATISAPTTNITREMKMRINQINWSAVPGDSYGFVCVYTNRTVYISAAGCTTP